MKIVLGVGGGIAAYKACQVLRDLTEAGHSVRVVPTANALEFVGAATWEALSGHPVATSVFVRVDEVEHVRIGQDADLVLIAPATADLLARIRAGRADDLLTATLLATRAPVVLAPAMHTEMWLNPATVDNVAVLRSRGVHVLDPASGRLTGKDSGPGRLPEPADIVEFALAAGGQDAPGVLSGRRVLVSAGGTREALDPVRFLGNRSSGKQGIAFARAARAAGAAVELVAANIDAALLAELPDDIGVTPVESTAELRSAMLDSQAGSDLLIMAAAVADYRPATRAEHKMKKDGDDGLTLRLVQNPDVLRELVAAKTAAGLDQKIIGFAAETGSAEVSALEYARRKFLRKGADFLVFNDVSAGRAFGTDGNSVVLFGQGEAGQPVELGHFSGDKLNVAQEVVSAVCPTVTG
jgi:phosphopantothenoylcysteine decarboxylase/phosphopantothenate--cysteine ligase